MEIVIVLSPIQRLHNRHQIRFILLCQFLLALSLVGVEKHRHYIFGFAFFEVEGLVQQLQIHVLDSLLSEILVEIVSVERKEDSQVDQQPVLTNFVSCLVPPGHVLRILPHVQKLRTSVDSVVRMVPIRLLVISPFRVIKVFLLTWLVVRPLACCILIDRLIHLVPIGSIVHIVLDIVSLSRDRVAEDLIGLLNLFEHLISFFLFLLSHILSLQEIRMVLLRHLVVRQLYILLFR